jgi:hypothetical protein
MALAFASTIKGEATAVNAKAPRYVNTIGIRGIAETAIYLSS